MTSAILSLIASLFCIACLIVDHQQYRARIPRQRLKIIKIKLALIFIAILFALAAAVTNGGAS